MARKKIREYDSKRLLKEHLKRLANIDLQIHSAQVLSLSSLHPPRCSSFFRNLLYGFPCDHFFISIWKLFYQPRKLRIRNKICLNKVRINYYSVRTLKLLKIFGFDINFIDLDANRIKLYTVSYTKCKIHYRMRVYFWLYVYGYLEKKN